MRGLKRGLWLIAIGAWMLVGATYVQAEEVNDPKEWIWGCQIKGRTLDGGCALMRFTQVGDADNDVDTDVQRILGFEPGNLQISKIDGKPIWERINQDMFLKPGETRLYSAAKCTCAR